MSEKAKSPGTTLTSSALVALLLVATSLLNSCQSVYRSEYLGVLPLVRDINRLSATRETDIVLRDHTRYRPVDLMCTGANCSWTLPNGSVKQVPIEEVAYVRFLANRNRASEIFGGLALGAVGGLFAAVEESTEPWDEDDSEMDIGLQQGMFIGAGAGLVMGIVVAASNSPELDENYDIYMLSDDESFLAHARSLPRNGENNSHYAAGRTQDSVNQTTIERQTDPELLKWRAEVQKELGLDATFWDQYDREQQRLRMDSVVRANKTRP